MGSLGKAMASASGIRNLKDELSRMSSQPTPPPTEEGGKKEARWPSASLLAFAAAAVVLAGLAARHVRSLEEKLLACERREAEVVEDALFQPFVAPSTPS